MAPKRCCNQAIKKGPRWKTEVYLKYREWLHEIAGKTNMMYAFLYSKKLQGVVYDSKKGGDGFMTVLQLQRKGQTIPSQMQVG